MSKLTDGPLATGSRLEVTFGKGPVRATIGLELTTVEEGRLMAWRSFSGPVRWEGEYRLATSGDGTELG